MAALATETITKSGQPKHLVGTKGSRRPRLNPQQLRFAREYAYDVMGNATKAAIAAGYSKATASAQANALLTQPRVIDEIDRLQARKLQKTEVLMAATISECARVAFSDINSLLDEKGAWLPQDQWPEDIRRAIASAEFNAKGQCTKLKFWSKVEALTLMAKYTGMLQEAAPDAGQPTKTEVTINLVQAPPQQAAAIIEHAPQYTELEHEQRATIEVRLLPAPDSSNLPQAERDSLISPNGSSDTAQS